MMVLIYATFLHYTNSHLWRSTPLPRRVQMAYLSMRDSYYVIQLYCVYFHLTDIRLSIYFSHLRTYIVKKHLETY